MMGVETTGLAADVAVVDVATGSAVVFVAFDVDAATPFDGVDCASGAWGRKVGVVVVVVVMATGAAGGCGGDAMAAAPPASGGNRFANWRMRSSALRRFNGCTTGAAIVREVFNVAGEACKHIVSRKGPTRWVTVYVPPTAACV